MEYEIDDKISEGTFGEIYSGTAFKKNGDKIPVVFKILKSDSNDQYKGECNEFIKKTPHENIVSIFECIDCKREKNKICNTGSTSGTRLVILEKVENDIADYLDSLDQDQDEMFEVLINIFIQISKGVKHLHEHGYVHTDIKTPNIMINAPLSEKIKSGDVKIIDLGTITENSSGNYSGGTPGFQDYCQYERKTNKPDLYSIDIYQLGATFYDILTNDLFQEIDIDQYPSPHLPQLKKDENYESLSAIEKLIVDMTDEFCDKRPKIDEVIKRLERLVI